MKQKNPGQDLCGGWTRKTKQCHFLAGTVIGWRKHSMRILSLCRMFAEADVGLGVVSCSEAPYHASRRPHGIALAASSNGKGVFRERQGIRWQN